MRAALFVVTTTFAVACTEPIVADGPGRYIVNDPSHVDIAAEAPRLCGARVRYSYDVTRKSSYGAGITRYWSEGLLVCDPNGPS